MKELKFYRCKHCGNVAWKPFDVGVDLVCCGEKMGLLNANTTDGAAEKHVPVIERSEGRVKVRVGEVPHPMLEEHYITFVVLQSGDDGVQFAMLQPGEAPEATFATMGDAPVTAYEYCNLHGLWKAEG